METICMVDNTLRMHDYRSIFAISLVSIYVATGECVDNVWYISYRSTDAVANSTRYIFDSMIPLGWMMSSNSAFLLLTVSLSVLGYILYRFRTISGVWFGMMWSVCATLPVLFFNADTWHVLLASRYTYHVRIGVSIVLAIAFVSLIKNNKYIRVAHRFVWVIVAGIVFQFVFMYRTTQTAYPYVYQTGRAMVKASEEIAYIHPDHVYIDFYRPFAQNTAHMVGALYVLSGMLEKDIYFLESVSSTPQSGDVLVKWNDTKNTYDVLSQ